MNLYVKNLHDEVDDEALRAEFSQVGGRWVGGSGVGSGDACGAVSGCVE
jgi:hypothetical protein